VVGGVVTLLMLPVIPQLLGVQDWFAIFGAWLVGGALMFVLGLVQLSRAISGYVTRPRLSGPLGRSLLSIGLPNWVLTLAERLPGTIMPIVVIELISPTTNAYWYTIWMMAWVIYIVPIQVGLSLFAEASHRPDRLALQIRQGIRISLLIGIAGAVVLAVLAHPILSLLKPVYATEGADALRILVLAVIPGTFIQAYFAACRSTRRLPEAIFTGIVSGTIGVTAAAVAGRDHGPDHPLVWMAVAWVVSQTLTGLWAFWRLRRIVNSTVSGDGPATADGLLTA
jgi:O-antigen/teichoic acid export membrane protein